MTGANWNGHRFVGLRQTNGTKVGAEPPEGKRGGGASGASGSIEEAAALRLERGEGSHRMAALVTPVGTSS
jgi:hypothetical protein